MNPICDSCWKPDGKLALTVICAAQHAQTFVLCEEHVADFIGSYVSTLTGPECARCDKRTSPVGLHPIGFDHPADLAGLIEFATERLVAHRAEER